MQKKNLTETEAAEEYGMSVHWYRRSRWAGDGPRFIKLGGAVLYPRTELDTFFDARLVKSTSEAAEKNPGLVEKQSKMSKRHSAL